MAKTIEYPPLPWGYSILPRPETRLSHSSRNYHYSSKLQFPEIGDPRFIRQGAGARLAKLRLACFDQQPGASAILRLPTIVLSVFVDIFVHLGQHVHVYREAMIARFSNATFPVFTDNKKLLPIIVFGKISFHCTRIPIIWFFIARST